MKRTKTPGLWAGMAMLAALFMVAPVWGQDEQFIPLFVYRTGPYAPNGIPVANGYVDYIKLLNARDGGINGVKITWEECETKYNTKLGVECYERLKNRGATGASLINPYSTGITYQLIPKASVDQLPIHSMGYGRTAAADGRIFKWIFNFPTTYWSQASTFVKYVGQQEGGMEALQGKKIALVYHKQPVRQGADSDADDSRRKIRLRPQAARHRSSGAGAEIHLAAGAPLPSGLDFHVGLGRHEPSGDQGSRVNPLSDGPLHRRVVVGDRVGRRARG